MTVSKFPAEGAVLEGGEEGVQLGEVGALRGLLALDGFDDGGEFLLEGKRRVYDWKLSQILQVDPALGDPFHVIS